MQLMHYAGQTFKIPADVRVDFERAAKTSANRGEFAWIEYTDPEGRVARFLVGPAIAIAFTDVPDDVGARLLDTDPVPGGD